MIGETFQKFIDEILKTFLRHEAKAFESSILDYKLKNYTVLQFPIENYSNFNEYENSLLVPNFSLKRNLTLIYKDEYDKLIINSILNITAAEFNAILGRSLAELSSRFVNCNSLTKDAVGSCAETLLRALTYRVFNGDDVALDFLFLSGVMSLAKISNKSIQAFGYTPPSEIVMNCFNSLFNQGFREELDRLSVFLIFKHAAYIVTLYSTYLAREYSPENSFKDNSRKILLGLSSSDTLAELLYAPAISVVFFLGARCIIDIIPYPLNEQNNNPANEQNSILARFGEYLFASNPNVFRNYATIVNRVFSRRSSSISRNQDPHNRFFSRRSLSISRNPNSVTRSIDIRLSIQVQRGQIQEGQIQEGQNNQGLLNSHISPNRLEPDLGNAGIDLNISPRAMAIESQSYFSDRISTEIDESEVYNPNGQNSDERNSDERNLDGRNQNLEAPLQTMQLRRSRFESVTTFIGDIPIRPLRSRSRDGQR